MQRLTFLMAETVHSFVDLASQNLKCVREIASVRDYFMLLTLWSFIKRKILVFLKPSKNSELLQSLMQRFTGSYITAHPAIIYSICVCMSSTCTTS